MPEKTRIRVPMGRRVGPCTYPTCDCPVYMPDSILEGEQRALCPRDVGDVTWNETPFRPTHALIAGRLFTLDPETGALRDDEGNSYRLVMT